MNTKIGMRVSYFEQHSEHIIVAKIDTKPTPTIGVEVYMPTSSAQIEEMYDEIKEIIQTVTGEEDFIMMGDWNSVVGKGRKGKEE